MSTLNSTRTANEASNRLYNNDVASVAEGLSLLVTQHVWGAIEAKQLGWSGDCQAENQLAAKYRTLAAAYHAHMRAAEESFFALNASSTDADVAFASKCISEGAWQELAR